PQSLACVHSQCLSLCGPPPRSTPFPYTTLFRSERAAQEPSDHQHRHLEHSAGEADRGSELGDSRHQTVAGPGAEVGADVQPRGEDRKSTRLNSSHVKISYAVFCLKKKNKPGGVW